MACWGDKDWEPEDLGEAIYEALIASNKNPAPLDYGIEIINSDHVDWSDPVRQSTEEGD